MNKSLLLLIAIISIPLVLGNNIGSGIGLNIEPEQFKPQIWLCDSRVVTDDAVESGRATDSGQELNERIENYAFEGEQIHWDVLVMDKNKIEEIEDVFVSIGPYYEARRMVPYQYFDQQCLSGCAAAQSACIGDAYDSCFNITSEQLNQTCYNAETAVCNSEKISCDAGCERTGMRLAQNDIEVECAETNTEFNMNGCNARLGEERLDTFDEDTMDTYECIFTVETPDSMYGEYWVTLEVEGTDGQYNHLDEVEYWFFNPSIALTIDGNVDFEDVRPGSVAYSTPVLVGNDADEGSGVLLDMFISGTDFYDPASSGAKCPTTNHLKLSRNDRSTASLGAGTNQGTSNACDIDTWINSPSELGVDNHDHLCYYAANGYTTRGNPLADAEGFRPIVYGDAFTRNFYNDAEIISNDDLVINNIEYDAGNVLSPGADISIVFKLGVPEPCVGDFSDGDIYFWGEAV